MKSQHLTLKGINQTVTLLKQGKIGVIPTDTIYGIVGSALKPDTVEEIYKLRKRSSDKPFIVLISSIGDLEKFDVYLTHQQRKFLQKIWPNPVSVILPCPTAKFKYLHRGKNSLAFRIPQNDVLLKILKKVGPLVAPSANYEGDPPAQTIDEAKKYFADQVLFYIDGGRLKSEPSTVIQLNNDGSVKTVRSGKYNIPGLW